MKRILLFLGTNIAILVVLGIMLQLLGFEGFLKARGTELNLEALLVFSAIFGMAGSVISLLISKWMAVKSTGAKIISTPADNTEQWLVSTVERHAREAGIGMPQVAIYPGEEMNAFATGANKNNALVAVSSGILQKMTREELEAVIGHEVSHIANGDMITLTLIQGVVNTFVIFLSRVIGFIVDRAVFKVQRGYGPGYYITVIIMQIILGILASIIVMWFSRYREFRADAGGAHLAGNRNMIAALRRLQSVHEPNLLPKQLSAFGISGDRTGGFRRLFMTHPPLEERIAVLENNPG